MSMRQVYALFLYGAALTMPVLAKADDHSLIGEDHWYLQAGSYFHYTYSSDHTDKPIFTSIEAVNADSTLYGLALFNNSFDQFSQYAYVGKTWNYHGNWQGFHTKLTAGLIHGYHGKYRNKIPLNNYGVAPAIIPGVGYNNGRYGADVIMLGLSGLLFTVGMDLK